MKRARTLALISTILIVALAGCSPETLTVAEVLENAQKLDGRQVRVQGWAYVTTDPYVGLIGCPPAGTLEDDVVVGQMFLFPGEDTSERSAGIAVSESSLHCEGTHCGLTCVPFDPGNMDYCMTTRGYSTTGPIMYELAGTLRAGQIGGETQLVLEDIDVSDSRRLIEESWEPVPEGPIGYMCP